MKSRRRLVLRLWVEELERRLVPSSALHGYSANWSGYAVETHAGAVSYVAGSWVVPTAASDVNNGYSVSWVGIDGATSSTVEQIGTQADFLNGHAFYNAWYQMYPSAPVFLTMPVTAGDAISASVSYAATTGFTLTINDSMWSQQFSTSQNASSAQRSSAEWIVEAPIIKEGFSYQIAKLADFGSETFTGAQATISGAPGPSPVNTSWPNTQLYQVDMASRNGSLKDSTSALDSTGTSFTVTFAASTVASNVTSQSTSSHSNKSGSHEPNVPALVVLIAPPPSITSEFVANTSLPPSQPVFTASLSTAVTAPTSVSSGATAVPFETAAGDANAPAGDNPQQRRELPVPMPGAAPAVPNNPPVPQSPSDTDAPPPAVPAPAPLAHPATVHGSAPAAWFGVLVGDATPPVVHDSPVPAAGDTGPGGTSVEVASVVLTLAFSGSCGLGMEDDTARRQRRPLCA
jgi:hypothetical protein